MTTQTQPYRPWPHDRRGRLLPSVPHAMSVYSSADHTEVAGALCRVSYASGQKFTVVDNARPKGVDWTADRWAEFLDSLVQPGRALVVHAPSCNTDICDGCDLSHVGRDAAPGQSHRRLGVVTGNPAPHGRTLPHPTSPARARINRMTAAGASVSQRTQRILAAATEVWAECEVSEVAEGHYCVREGARSFDVHICADWSHDPRCTCAEARRSDSQGFCRHTVALLLREEHLRCQLLEFFL